MLLDTAARVGGLNVITNSGAGGWYGSDCTSSWTDAQAQGIAQTTAGQLAGYPAFFAYGQADEPLICQLGSQRMLHAALSAVDPSQTVRALYMPGSSRPTWIAADTTLDYSSLTHDEYPVTSTTASPDPILFPSWENDLDTAWRMTPLDKPWWQVVQAFGEKGYWRQPDRIEERYLVYSALAYGARGIFFFVQRQVEANDFTGAISDADGNLIDGAGAVVPALAHELAVVGPLLVDATRDDARTGRVGGQGCGAGPNSAVVAYVGARGPADCDLFTFTRASGEKVLVLVNKHRTTQVFDLFVNKVRVPQGTGTPTLIDALGGPLAVHDAGAQLEVLFPLAPGDGRVIRVVPPYQAQIEVSRERTLHAVGLGQSVAVRATVTDTGSQPWTSGPVLLAARVAAPGTTGGAYEPATSFSVPLPGWLRARRVGGRGALRAHGRQRQDQRARHLGDRRGPDRAERRLVRQRRAGEGLRARRDLGVRHLRSGRLQGPGRLPVALGPHAALDDPRGGAGHRRARTDAREGSGRGRRDLRGRRDDRSAAAEHARHLGDARRPDRRRRQRLPLPADRRQPGEPRGALRHGQRHDVLAGHDHPSRPVYVGS